MYEELKRKEAERQKAFSARRPALLQTLRAMVLTDELKNPVILQYEGCGDSGGFEDVPNKLPEEVEDFLWDLLTQNESGWEDNDGGRGDIKWDINDDKITINHTEYYTESKNRQYKY